MTPGGLADQSSEGPTQGGSSAPVAQSELDRVRASLARSRQREQLALAAAGLGLFEWDVEADAAVWENDRIFEIFGRHRDSGSINRREFLERFIVPEDREPFDRSLQDAIAEGSRFRVSCRMRRGSDGELRWIEIVGDFARDATGRVHRMVGVVADITDEQAARTALVESESRYRVLAEAMPFAVWQTDARGHVEYLNVHARQQTGFPSSPEADWLAGVHPADVAEVSKLREDAARTGAPVDVELRLHSESAKDARWFRVIGAPVRDASGTVVRWVGASVDVSDQRTLRERVRRSSEVFQTLVRRSPFGIYVVDADSRIAVISSGAEDVFRNVQPVIGRPLAEVLRFLWPEAFVTDALARFEHTLLTGEPFVSTNMVQTRADIGEVQSYDWRLERIEMPDGRLGVVCYFYDLSERSRWERALRQSEELFQTFMNHSPLAAWMVDPDGNVTYVSPGYSRLFGVKDIQGRNVFDVYPPDLAEEYQRNHRLALEENRVINTVEAGIRHDGSRGQFLVVKFPVEYAERKLVGGVSLDVTELKQAEIALRESEARSLRAQRGARVGVWEYDVPSGRTYWSDVMWDLYGRTPAQGHDAAGEAFRAGIHPEDRARIEAAAVNCLRGNAPRFREEFRILHPDGSIRWIESAADVVRDVHGQATGLAGINIDITARKEDQERLAESERRFRTAFENAAVGIAHVGLDGRWLRINQRVCEITGYTDQELRSMTFMDLTHPDDVEPDWAEARRLLAGEISTYSLEKRYIRRDATLVPIELTVSLSRLPSGEPEYFISVIQDISGRKAAEESLRRHSIIFENQSDAIILTDLEGRIMDWNPACTKMLGYEKHEVVGKTTAMFHRPQDAENLTRDAIAAMVRDGIWSGQIIFVRKDGTHGVCETIVKPVTDERGRLIGAVGVNRDVSSTIEAERARRESESQFRMLADNISQFAWTADPSGLINWYNRRWYEYTGTTLEQVQGLGWQRVHHPDHVERATRKYLEHIRRGVAWEDTFPLRGRDGRFRWFLSRAVPVRDEHGVLVRWFGTNTDVTEQKESEEALRRSEERFRELADSMPQLVWVARDDGSVSYYNSQMVNYSGIKALSLDAWEWAPVVHPEDIAGTMKAWREAVASGSIYQCEQRIRMADGSFRWHLSRARRTGDAGHAQWFGTATDIHELKLAQQVLRESQERFRVMADGLELPLWVHDAHGTLEFVNGRFRDFFGVRGDDLTSLQWRFMLHPEDADQFADAFSLAYEHHSAFHSVARARRADGQWRWLESWGRPRFSGAGDFMGIVGASADITDRRDAEEELRRHREHLQQLVDERTAELQDSLRRLGLAERMAALGTLSAGLGHDMANILLPMRMSLSELEQFDLPQAGKDNISVVQRSTEYLKTLASGLRLLALDPDSDSMTGASTTLESWWLDVAGICKATLHSGVSMTARGLTGLSPVAIPPHALTQIVYNLVQNAGDVLRSREAGTITIEAQDAGDRIRLSIQDDGPGMTPEVRARCLEPFFTTKARGRGTGLGLAIVYRLANRFGAGLEIESEVGVGSTFILSIPKCRQIPASRLRGMISIGDVRAGALTACLLGVAGASVVDELTEPSEPCIWVVDESVSERAVAGFIAVHPRSCAIRVASKSALGPRVVHVPAARVMALHAAIQRAVQLVKLQG